MWPLVGQIIAVGLYLVVLVGWVLIVWRLVGRKLRGSRRGCALRPASSPGGPSPYSEGSDFTGEGVA